MGDDGEEQDAFRFMCDDVDIEEREERGVERESTSSAAVSVNDDECDTLF